MIPKKYIVLATAGNCTLRKSSRGWYEWESDLFEQGRLLKTICNPNDVLTIITEDETEYTIHNKHIPDEPYWNSNLTLLNKATKQKVRSGAIGRVKEIYPGEKSMPKAKEGKNVRAIMQI